MEKVLVKILVKIGDSVSALEMELEPDLVDEARAKDLAEAVIYNSKSLLKNFTF